MRTRCMPFYLGYIVIPSELQAGLSEFLSLEIDAYCAGNRLSDPGLAPPGMTRAGRERTGCGVYVRGRNPTVAATVTVLPCSQAGAGPLKEVTREDYRSSEHAM